MSVKPTLSQCPNVHLYGHSSRYTELIVVSLSTALGSVRLGQLVMSKILTSKE